MKNNILHITLALVLVVLLVLLSDPFMIWMPPMATMTALFSVAIIMCIWGGFVMKENARDERELLHRMNAGRIAYLSGVSILTFAFIVQGISHQIDPWIAIALGVMVVAKISAHIYSEHFK